jgi:hypothetical protein
MKEIGVINLYGKVYVSVDDLVQICREQGKEFRFSTIACHALLSEIIIILNNAKKEQYTRTRGQQ